MITPDELPFTPFSALRATYGMLLGEDDFHVLAGNPRGKQMLHNAWLHGPGVVRGFAVGLEEKTGKLRVDPGLAVDGRGRELHLDEPKCVAVEAVTDKATRYLVARFRACQDRPVPAFSDPCDIDRTAMDHSRHRERIELALEEAAPGTGHPDPVPGPYRGLRVLLGIDLARDTDVDQRAVDALERVRERPVAERPEALVAAFRRIAAHDVTLLEPLPPDTGDYPDLPVEEDDEGILLAEVTLEPGCRPVWTIECRRSLVATGTVQELTCALAPGLLLDRPGLPLGGPRVLRDTITWEDERTLVLEFSKPVQNATLTRETVTVSSIASSGWNVEYMETLEPDPPGTTTRCRVQLSREPRDPLVRLVVRGTGPTPVCDADGVPLAGCDDDPPGTVHQGHDAVHQLRAAEDPATYGSKGTAS